jgi:hypothetical protein
MRFEGSEIGNISWEDLAESVRPERTKGKPSYDFVNNRYFPISEDRLLVAARQEKAAALLSTDDTEMA